MNRGIQRIFSEVPPTYELVNHILTLGFDIILRRQAARLAILETTQETGVTRKYLDVCSGTGELARSLAQLAPLEASRPRRDYGITSRTPQVTKGDSVSRKPLTGLVDDHSIIIALDFCYPMLVQGINKLRNASISPTLADVGLLPFPTNTFDAVTISFATRNINTHRQALLNHLREIHRVLKPEGRFINLETSQPKSRLLKWLFHTGVKTMVNPVGGFISGSRQAYTYLSHTIPRFYSAPEFSDMLYQTGFSRVRFEAQCFGMAAIHIAVK